MCLQCLWNICGSKLLEIRKAREWQNHLEQESLIHIYIISYACFSFYTGSVLISNRICQLMGLTAPNFTY